MEHSKNQTDLIYTQQIIKQVINAWEAQNNALTAFLNKYDAPAYFAEVAPGRNRAIYLIGHLIAANDGMLPLFGLSERLYPQLAETFTAKADKTVEVIPSVAELKQQWETVHARLTNHFNNMKPEDWLDRHTAVSEKDFSLEPLRNKLNALIGRTNHQSYHLGQLNLLMVKEQG